MIRVRCIGWVFFCLFAAAVTAGCSRTVAEQGAVMSGKWICDREADEAMKKKDYARGIVLHEHFLKKSAQNALAMDHLGYAYGQMGDHAREIECYKKAISLGFRDGHIFFNLGMAYGEIDQIEDAIKALEEAVRIDPENAEYHYGLAMAYRANGQEGRCREELLETLKKEPGHMDAKRALQGTHIKKREPTPDAHFVEGVRFYSEVRPSGSQPFAITRAVKWLRGHHEKPLRTDFHWVYSHTPRRPGGNGKGRLHGIDS